MGKLGFLKINTSTPGDNYNTNGVWNKKVESDIRFIFNQCFQRDTLWGKELYLLKFLGGEGYLVASIVIPSSGSSRGDENHAYWLHIPADTKVAGEETISLLGEIKRAEADAANALGNRLGSIFSKEYPTREVLPPFVSTIQSKNNGQFACRYYNDASELASLLGDCLAQSEYANYQGIFLLDRASGVQHSAGCIDISNHPLKKVTVYPVPRVADDYGFEPYLQNGSRYTKPIEADADPTIVWKKEGYKDIQKSWNNSINRSDILVEITSKQFHIVDETNTNVWEPSISINGHQLPAYLHEDECANAKITITANGYEEYNNVRPIAAGQSLEIKMSKKEYTFDIFVFTDANLQTREQAKLIVRSTKSKDEIRLPGYENKGDYFQREKDSSPKNTNPIYALILIVGILIGILGTIVVKGHPDTSKSEGETVTTEPVGKDEEPATPSEHNLAAYLDRNDVWQSDSLFTLSNRKDIFGQLCDFDYSKLKDNKEAMESTKFKEVYNLLDSVLHKAKIPKDSLVSARKQYCGKDRENIDLAKYKELLRSREKYSSARKKKEENNPPAGAGTPTQADSANNNGRGGNGI